MSVMFSPLRRMRPRPCKGHSLRQDSGARGMRGGKDQAQHSVRGTESGLHLACFLLHRELLRVVQHQIHVLVEPLQPIACPVNPQEFANASTLPRRLSMGWAQEISAIIRKKETKERQGEKVGRKKVETHDDLAFDAEICLLEEPNLNPRFLPGRNKHGESATIFFAYSCSHLERWGRLTF